MSKNLLLYTSNVALASRLNEVLTQARFSVTTTYTEDQFAEAFACGSYDAIVTSTRRIRAVRAVTTRPILNYEVFVFSKPVDKGSLTSAPRSPRFDIGALLERLRFHLPLLRG
jgi:hypothetical protein